MSSILASPVEPPKTRSAPLFSARAASEARRLAHTVFGCLLLVASFYLVLCYVTFDFYGILNSPFFTWLRQGAFAAQLLYFPAFAGALLAIAKEHSFLRKLAGVFLALQIVCGFLFYFSSGLKSPFGWALVYGPNLRNPLGTGNTYAEGVACLVPLAWISGLRIAAAIRAAGNTITRRGGLTSFILAGSISSILYAGAATIRLADAGQAASAGAAIFSIALNLELFLGIFLFFECAGWLASRSRNPGLVQFVVRCISVWFMLAVILRKIIFALVGFNSTFADFYAAAFSFTAVLFIAGQMLNSRHASLLLNEERGEGQVPRGALQWARRAIALAGILLFFYVFAVRMVTIDWGHIIGSISALLVEFGLLWFFLKFFPSSRTFKVSRLVVVAVILSAGAVSIKMAAERENLADNLEQYADYNPSLFAIRQVFTPIVKDDQYTAWYQFLREHANIRQHVTAPDVKLTQDLRPLPGKKPNIFVFVIDALRRDYVSAYNPKVSFTPALSAFSRDSIVFQHAYTHYAGTDLSDAELLSGYQQLHDIFPQPASRLNNLQKMVQEESYQSYVSFNPAVAILDKNFSDIIPLMATSNEGQHEFGAIIDQLERALLERKDPNRPVFVFSQPENVHTLWLAWHRGEVNVKPHPGFNDAYASSVEHVDQVFGNFIGFLKEHGLYQNSIIIVTADHGESLGEMGRESHVENLTPEVIQIPLVIHLPQMQQSKLFWDSQAVVTLRDITPSLYYLLGYPLVQGNDFVGHPLFTASKQELSRRHPDHYLLMSSYMPVFGVLSQDQTKLFYVDATLKRSYYYDLQDDPKALKNRISLPVLAQHQAVLQQDLLKIDKFYDVNLDAQDH